MPVNQKRMIHPMPLALPLSPAGGDDLLLAGEVGSGIPGAWERLVDLHGGIVYALIARWGYAEERDDLAQEIFVLVWRRISTFRGDSSLRTWIYKVAINHLRNHAHRTVPKRQRELRESDMTVDDTDQAPLDRVVANSDSPAEAYEKKSHNSVIRAALDTLPPIHREVLVMKELEDLSCEEIAGILGVATGTVKSRLYRARAALVVAFQLHGVLR